MTAGAGTNAISARESKVLSWIDPCQSMWLWRDKRNVTIPRWSMRSHSQTQPHVSHCRTEPTDVLSYRQEVCCNRPDDCKNKSLVLIHELNSTFLWGRRKVQGWSLMLPLKLLQGQTQSLCSGKSTLRVGECCIVQCRSMLCPPTQLSLRYEIKVFFDELTSMAEGVFVFNCSKWNAWHPKWSPRFHNRFNVSRRRWS